MDISTHTPLAGRDLQGKVEAYEQADFYSHAPRGARLSGLDKVETAIKISTHTPLAGRDHN